MNWTSSAYLLISAVALVGVLHTLVPDHWAPIAVIARQRGWSSWQTARAAAIAGTGHTLSTLFIAVIVWFGGLALAIRYGHLLSTLSSFALIGFGGWIAIASLRELHRHDHGHSNFGHAHIHRHRNGIEHRHWHEHYESDRHEIEGSLALTPSLHEHAHETSSRTALLLIIGSSPMIEGIPAFFAAARFGVSLLVVMGLVFATCTIATYVALSAASAVGMQNVNLGPLERYGEVLSGAFIAALGPVFLMFPSL